MNLGVNSRSLFREYVWNIKTTICQFTHYTTPHYYKNMSHRKEALKKFLKIKQSKFFQYKSTRLSTYLEILVVKMFPLNLVLEYQSNHAFLNHSFFTFFIKFIECSVVPFTVTLFPFLLREF